MIPTGWQIRGGRELVSLCQADLAKAAEVSLAVVCAGAPDRMKMPMTQPSSVIRAGLAAAGIASVQGSGGTGYQGGEASSR